MTVTLVTDTELDETIEATLIEKKIPYIVDKDSKLGEHIHNHNGNNINAVVDGVYIPELDPARGIGKRVKVITAESLNKTADVDAYLVDDDVVAESLESSGKRVLRSLDELVDYITV